MLEGRYESSSRVSRMPACSFSAAKWATPDFWLCASAPPRSSLVTSSCVTVLMTSGPVMNMYEVSFTITMKSVMAGEYTAPPAHGPEDERDLRHHARGERVAQEDVRVAGEALHALLDARAARVVEADDRRAHAGGQVHDLADLLRVGAGERAAEDGEVLGEDEDLAAVDACRSR